MQTVQSLKDGIWNLPNTVTSFLARDEPVPSGNSNDTNNNGNAMTNSDISCVNNPDAESTKENADKSCTNEVLVEEGVTVAAASTSSSLMSYDDDILERSHAIPYALIKEQWQLVLDQEEETTIPQMEVAINKCKDLVLQCTDDSDERKWLVRHLIELRHRLRELQDLDSDPDAVPTETKVILGHHFVRHENKSSKRKLHCDHCAGIIWNVVQTSFVCTDCSFVVHQKCMRNVIRICAHVITTERNLPIECICPEIGLAFQKYTCAECGTQLSYNVSTAFDCFGVEFKAESLNSIAPRLCDYSGLYYCPLCHWNDTSIIPARVMNNWDFVPRKVGRASLQQIRLLHDRPVIHLEDRNPRLFQLIALKLGVVKKLRHKLTQMRPYLMFCRIAEELRLIRDTIGTKRHLMQNDHMYSVADLVGVEKGTLPEFLRRARDIFERHIRNCVICSGKAYICEVCNNDEILFPFDDAAIACTLCNSISHKVCHERKNQNCLKCARLKIREQQMRNEILDAANGN
ncbi:LOW QUALITY PROTEIN: differentially expressed in FDCP 8 homolog [Armigeres subalbatus]|uniref:LOW QUALITY PROTEIN: differentially expressed in FDCP 8 homolog n=1 Tax=Armigeres subalbatus TaxID=124917 RepID=UPI002ED47146